MDPATVVVRGDSVLIRRFEVAVVDGPDRGVRVVSQSDELSIGTAEGNDLRLTDPAVSRHHCALRAGERGLALVDLGSRNGTFLGDVGVFACLVRTGGRVRVGKSTLGVRVLDDEIEQPIAASDRLGSILGGSVAMRRLYPLVEQFGRSSATVLIHGETGTGKELIAEAIHRASDRRDGPYVIVDCSALAHDLAESELFGHERGSFTGAELTRVGAFESATGGTIFLDEIGELSPALQPLLLRVLEGRTVRRIGSNQHRTVDVRVIAASHRDLRSEVNEKRFRADLFYRLNVLRIAVPPLRERAGDVELLARHFWRQFRPDSDLPLSLVPALAGQRARAPQRDRAERAPGRRRERPGLGQRSALVPAGQGAGDRGVGAGVDRSAPRRERRQSLARRADRPHGPQPPLHAGQAIRPGDPHRRRRPGR